MIDIDEKYSFFGTDDKFAAFGLDKVGAYGIFKIE